MSCRICGRCSESALNPCYHCMVEHVKEITMIELKGSEVAFWEKVYLERVSGRGNKLALELADSAVEGRRKRLPSPQVKDTVYR